MELDDAPVAPIEGRVRVRPELDLAVRAWDGADPPFILVHGLASNARLWDGVGRELHAAGHRVVAVDQRGHGRSDKPDHGYDYDTVTDDLRRLMEELELHRPVLVGQSWGGNVVCEAGVRWGGALAGVVGVDGGAIDLQHRFPDWEVCAEQLAPPSFAGVTRDQVAKWMRDRHPDWSDEAIAGSLANLADQPDGTVQARLARSNHMQILRHLWAQRPAERYPAITAPVLLIPADTGDADQTSDKRVDVDAALAAIPRARARWLTGDHDLHAQQPEAVADLLLDAVEDGYLGR